VVVELNQTHPRRFMGVGQLLTMPLFFASIAIYPTSTMPHRLQMVSRLNPLMIHHHGYGDFVVDGETLHLKSKMP
jgi:ABC-type polysaccharide/polyol phosphate export permease